MGTILFLRKHIDNIYISSAPVVQKIPIIQTKIISKKGNVSVSSAGHESDFLFSQKSPANFCFKIFQSAAVKFANSW